MDGCIHDGWMDVSMGFRSDIVGNNSDILPHQPCTKVLCDFLKVTFMIDNKTRCLKITLKHSTKIINVKPRSFGSN